MRYGFNSCNGYVGRGLITEESEILREIDIYTFFEYCFELLCLFGNLFAVLRHRRTVYSLLCVLFNHLVDYPTRINISYMWGFGSLAGIFLVNQVLTGISLTFHYVGTVDTALASIERLMRIIRGGWLIRYMHSNGASIILIVVYIHVIRGMYHGSIMSPRKVLWASGVIMFILIMLTAILGYVLRWGEMSYWGTTVITNMVTIIPYLGNDITELLWGGWSIGPPTLVRIYSLHYIVRTVLCGLSIFHISLLHNVGSGNRLGASVLESIMLTIYPYCFVKDVYVLLLTLCVIITIVIIGRNMMGDIGNIVDPDPSETRAGILPEWYILPFYAMLSAVPHKTGGVLTMFISILVVGLMGVWSGGEIRVSNWKSLGHFVVMSSICSGIFLGYIGGKGLDEIILDLGQYITVIYILLMTFGVYFVSYYDTRVKEFLS